MITDKNPKTSFLYQYIIINHKNSAAARVGVNSIPELELQLNSNSNSGIGIELELKLVELKMELELKTLELELELELKTGIEFFCNCYCSNY